MRKVIDGLACNTGHKTQSSYVQRLYNKYQENVPSIIFLKIYLLCTYLFYLFFPASGLSCSMRHLLLWRVGFSLVVACRFSLSSCGTQVPQHVGSVVCSTRALVGAHELRSCGVRA